MQQELIQAQSGTCLHPTYTQLVVIAVFWQGDILLIQRRSQPFKGLWSLPGGHVEKGETYHQAALRELSEETGIQADELAPVAVFIDHQHRLECHGFTYNSGDGSFSSPGNEEQDVTGWHTVAESLRLPLTPGLKEMLQTFCRDR